MTEPLTEKLLSCYKVKGFSSLLVCFAFIFCRAIVDFTFGLLDCVRYNEDFITSRFVKSRFCSIHFTVTFGGAEEYRSLYSEDFVIQKFVKSRFHCDFPVKPCR